MNSEKNLKDNKQKKNKKYGNFYYDFVKVTGALPVLLWMRPKILRPYGKKKLKGGVLISANHRSYLDPIIVHCAFSGRRLHSLATKDLFNTKLKSAFFNRMHCIEVDKDNFTLSAFHEIVTRLKDGKAVVIFPEGQINTSQNANSLLTFKSGAALMAHKSAAPILPVYIVKREKWYQRQRIVVGEPVDIRAMVGDTPTMADFSRVSEYLRDKEMELMEYYEGWRNRKNKTIEDATSKERQEIKQ